MGDNCEHSLGGPTTMYKGKVWRCVNCGQLMRCKEPGEHEEVDG